MDAEQKVTAETYRERDLPPVVPLSGVVAALSLVLAVIMGLCGGMPIFEPQTARWFVVAMLGLATVSMVALVVFAVSGVRYFVWRFGMVSIPPNHTIRVQFMRMLSDLGYLPQDVTKWKSRKVSVRSKDYRAYITVRGGLLKDLESLANDLLGKGYMEGGRNADLVQKNAYDANDGYVIVIDYMNPKCRAELQDAMDRREW